MDKLFSSSCLTIRFTCQKPRKEYWALLKRRWRLPKISLQSENIQQNLQQLSQRVDQTTWVFSNGLRAVPLIPRNLLNLSTTLQSPTDRKQTWPLLKKIYKIMKKLKSPKGMPLPAETFKMSSRRPDWKLMPVISNSAKIH